MTPDGHPISPPTPQKVILVEKLGPYFLAEFTFITRGSAWVQQGGENHHATHTHTHCPIAF